MKLLLLLFTTLFLSVSVFSQEKTIELVHKKRNKVELIKLNSPIVLVMTEKRKIRGTLIDFDKNNLTIRDNKGIVNNIDILTIHKIKRDRFKNRRWLEPFGYIGIGAGLALVATPFIWIFDGGAKAQEGLEFAGILASVSFPVILIGKSKRSFNVKKNWTLIVRNE